MTLYPYGYSSTGGNGAAVDLAIIKASHSWQMLHPEVQRRAEALMIAGGGVIGFGQGFRDPAAADALFIQRHYVIPCPGGISFQGQCWALKAGYSPSMPADRSYHCPTPLPQDGTLLSMAIDFLSLDPTWAWFNANCGKYGFVNYIAGEVWHGQPPEFPHARSDYNLTPGLYRLTTWPLPGLPAPLPPSQEDDMAKVVKPYDGPDLAHIDSSMLDPAAFALVGGIASWIGDLSALSVQHLIGTIPMGDPIPVPRSVLKAYRLVGPAPPVGYGYARPTTAADFAQ